MNYKESGLLHEQFIRQAKETPSNIAVVDEKQGCLTYKKLDNLTNKLATVLRDNGVKENTVVIIYMDKCSQYVVSYIAILKAGGAYLPLDISYPDPLIRDILKETEPLCILTKSDYLKNLEFYKDSTKIISLDDNIYALEIERLSGNKSPIVLTNLTLESLAFLVYSSGTTGKPKGIMLPLRAPIISYLSRYLLHPYDNNEREASNVFFVWELLRPLLKGQTLYIIPDDVIYDPAKLLDFLRENEITRMLFTPSLLETILDFPVETVEISFKTMKKIWLCGEVTTTTLIERALRILPHVQFINLYSISECHDVADINLTKFYSEQPQKLKSSKFTPVGSLLPLIKVVILDDNLKVMPVGIPGEIYVYGPTLARGYLKRPDLNGGKFIPLLPELVTDQPCEEKMYKTGDLGYLLSDGSLEISGRCDAMVKIRGYSVEMAAIEHILMELSFVQSCVVVTHGDEGDDKCLVAYIVPSGPVSVKTVRGELKRRLPFYMIPSYFVFLKEIPILAASGKLNKNALPTFDQVIQQNKPEYLPETETEHVLSEIWSNVLQISSIDIQESFFDLGGHSLLAAKLLQLVNNKLNIQISVKDLYLNPTIFQMGKLIDKQSTDSEMEIDLEKEVDIHCQYNVDFDIQLRAFWRFSNFNKTRWSSARVLLTGSTGFLGAFILAELLKSTESHVFVLIRENIGNFDSKNLIKIQKRLNSTMRKYYLLNIGEDNENKEQVEQLINERVTFVKGDVSIINFGLSENDYRYLSTEIDYIIHAAAYVNLTYPYSALYSTNVLGTCNVIKFACYSKIKPLHYISTDAVFPDNMVCNEEFDIKAHWRSLTTGYSQTKWVAEQMVSRMSQMGHPLIIYRLGNQGPDSINAALNKDDFNFMMIRSFSYLGCFPSIDWKIEMTPVNFSAEIIVKFAKLLPDHVGKIYHLINYQPISIGKLRSWMYTLGYSSHFVTYDEYLEKMKLVEPEFLSKLCSMLSENDKSANYFKNLPIHDSINTRQVLSSINIPYPEIDFNLFNLYLTKFINRNIIPQPKIQETIYKLIDENNLSGSIVFITGASSGIGEETAIQLSKFGCLVALVSRNMNRLHIIQEKIKINGGQAICVKADVTLENEVIEAVQFVENTLGTIDILINCAGLMFYQHVYHLDMIDCNAMIDVNIKGLLYCTTHILKEMKLRKRGHIVNISSDAGKVGFPGLAVYSGTKFFVEGYSQSLRKEVCDFNIKVTCVQPGDVRTPLQDKSISNNLTAKDYFTVSNDSVILEPKDIAKAIVYVVSSPSYVAVNELLVQPISRPI